MLGALYTVLTKGTDLGWIAAFVQLIVMSAIAALHFWPARGEPANSTSRVEPCSPRGICPVPFPRPANPPRVNRG